MTSDGCGQNVNFLATTASNLSSRAVNTDTLRRQTMNNVQLVSINSVTSVWINSIIFLASGPFGISFSRSQ